MPFRAKVIDWVVPGSVEVNVGGGGPLQPEPWREANANYLTDMDNRDPISGFPVLKPLLCEVQKASAGEYVCQREPSLCLISLIHKPEPGYAYWVGTSFSTPLVSGLAALMLEKERELIISTSSVNVASTISTTITAGACPPATPPTPHCLGAGIVNVRHTMQGSACPVPILTP